MLDILCMISGEGEEVPLTPDAPVEPVPPTPGIRFDG